MSLCGKCGTITDPGSFHSCSTPIPESRGATGWWLLGYKVREEWFNRRAIRMTCDDIGSPPPDIQGHTYDPQAVLDWVREGKLP